MANFLTSSIGKKFIQSISGAFLIIFMLLHASINFFSVIDSFKGTYGAEDGLFAVGLDGEGRQLVAVREVTALDHAHSRRDGRPHALRPPGTGARQSLPRPTSKGRLRGGRTQERPRRRNRRGARLCPCPEP